MYQTPQQAWKFVIIRQQIEGRYIPPDMFIEQNFATRTNANSLKRNFDSYICLDLLLKNIDGTNRLNWTFIDQIDNHVTEVYRKDEIKTFVRKIDRGHVWNYTSKIEKRTRIH